LPRKATIDKARARLPGGFIAGYRISAPEVTTLSAHLLQVIGQSEDEFVRWVFEASTDEDIVDRIRTSVAPRTITEWNAWVSALRIRDCSAQGRASLYASNPKTIDLPDDTLVMDALDYEDQEIA
jgi:hypothetical protein